MIRRACIIALFVFSFGIGARAQSYEDQIYSACTNYGCDGGTLVRIMYCESEGNPSAWHANPYGGSDIGLFQINDATWGSIATAGPEAQIQWAAQMAASGQLGIWWPSQWCWG